MCLIFNGYVVTFKHNTIEEYEGVEFFLERYAKL